MAVDDRTHRGGAVLWYLRKHAPMPVTYAEVEDAKGGTDANPKEQPSERQPKRPPGAAGPRRKLAPQRDFLHRTLCAIGADLDESKQEAEKGTPVLAVDERQSTTAHREYLRKRFVKYNDEECARLKAQVKAKEAEIAALSQKVEELRRFVENTRIACKQRLAAGNSRSGTNDPPEQDRASELPAPPVRTAQFNMGSAVLSAMVRTRHQFLDLSGNQVFDADTRASGGNVRSALKAKDAVEELQERIKQQKEVEQQMHAQVFELAKQLKQQTIQRKAQEAGLFSKNAEILQLRARTLQTEARVTRLANELRRIYRQVPTIMQQRLDQTSPKRAENMASEFAFLQEGNKQEHLKFLSCDDLVAEVGNVNNGIKTMEKKKVQADKVLQQGAGVAKAVADKMHIVHVALASLCEAWTKLHETADDMGQTGQQSPRPSVGPLLSHGQAGLSMTTIGTHQGLLGETVEVQAVLKDAMLATSIIQAIVDEECGTSGREAPDRSLLATPDLLHVGPSRHRKFHRGPRAVQHSASNSTRN